MVTWHCYNWKHPIHGWWSILSLPGTPHTFGGIKTVRNRHIPKHWCTCTNRSSEHRDNLKGSVSWGAFLWQALEVRSSTLSAPQAVPRAMSSHGHSPASQPTIPQGLPIASHASTREVRPSWPSPLEACALHHRVFYAPHLMLGSPRLSGHNPLDLVLRRSATCELPHSPP